MVTFEMKVQEDVVKEEFDKFEKEYLIPKGFNFTSIGFSHNEIELVSEVHERYSFLNLIEKETESYSFKFYDGNLYVYDYFNHDNFPDFIAKYNDAKAFNNDYDMLGLAYDKIVWLCIKLNIGYMNGFVSIDSLMISHFELRDRIGWNDRRIKKHFGIVKRDVMDLVQYYPMNEVLLIESQVER